MIGSGECQPTTTGGTSSSLSWKRLRQGSAGQWFSTSGPARLGPSVVSIPPRCLATP